MRVALGMQYRSVILSISPSTTLVKTEISQQLLDRLHLHVFIWQTFVQSNVQTNPQGFVHTFMVPSG